MSQSLFKIIFKEVPKVLLICLSRFLFSFAARFVSTSYQFMALTFMLWCHETQENVESHKVLPQNQCSLLTDFDWANFVMHENSSTYHKSIFTWFVYWQCLLYMNIRHRQLNWYLKLKTIKWKRQQQQQYHFVLMD